jgi:hypothetical protein
MSQPNATTTATTNTATTTATTTTTACAKHFTFEGLMLKIIGEMIEYNNGAIFF